MPRNLISIVRSMLDRGASVEEVVSTLREMGIPEEDARKLIILAHREMLLTLRNELRDIVRSVLEEEKEHMYAELREEVKNYVDTQMRMVNRNLFRYLRDEVGKYLSELSKLEEKVELIDRRLLDLEKEVYRKERKITFAGGIKLGRILMLLGGGALAAAFLLPLDIYARAAVGLVGIVFVVGGVLLD